MSALTKIFVVLHVVISLLLSSALIVFVNRQENNKENAKIAMQKQAIAERNTSLKDQDILKVTNEKNNLATELTNQINTAKAATAEGEKTIAGLQVQVAEAGQAKAQVDAQNTSLAAALQVAQADIKVRQEGYNALLTEKDKTQKELVDAGNRITELTNANEVLARQGRYVQEQIAQLQQQNALLMQILQKYNISPTGTSLPAGGAINPTPSVNINGIVRDFKSINGVPFATISLGSADAVTRGMKFNVIDPNKKLFLGYFTVDTVGVHEATGRLDGPAVDQVRPNVSEVRTQL